MTRKLYYKARLAYYYYIQNKYKNAIYLRNKQLTKKKKFDLEKRVGEQSTQLLNPQK